MTDVLLHYQRRLVELLRADTPPAEIRAVLGSDPALSSLRAYVAELDDTALIVASRLLAVWSSE